MFDKDILDNLKGQEIKELIIENKVTLEELDTSALEKLLDYETDMLCLDMGDMELIHACAARLDELNGPVMTDEEFWSIVKKAEERMVSCEKENTPVDAPVNAPARVVKKRIIWKKVWLVAAIIVLLISAATMTASAFGFNVFEYFREVIGLSVGEKVDKGAITLINNGNKEEYSSMDDLLSSQNMNILFPCLLPQDVNIKSVCISKNASGGQFIEFITNDSYTYISVDTNVEESMVTGHTQKHIIGDYTYYIFSNENFAICYHNDCYYYISSDSNENLMMIIKNMREK